MPASGLSGVLKLIHVVFAVVWVGGAAFLALYGLRLARADISARIAFARQGLVAGRIFAAAGMVTLLAGVWLVLRENLWGFDQAWVSIGLAGIALGTVLGPAFYGPQARAVIAELEGASPAAGPRFRRIGVVSALEAAFLLVVVWAMVYKPGGPF